jgi:LemA protein
MHSLIVLVPVLAFFAWATWIYNRLVLARSRQGEAWCRVDEQLAARRDLVGPLRRCVAAHRAHESPAFRSREVPQEAGDVVLELRRLLAEAEANPEIKSSRTFLHLLDELVRTDSALPATCREYNAATDSYRKLSRALPNALIAGIFGFQAGAAYQAEPVLA